MLSKLAIFSSRPVTLSLVAVRATSTSAIKTDAAVLNIREGPERDLVNFPRRVREIYPANTRIGLFPESWFHAMHAKTGVCGPYLFGIGFYMFLLSKEILVYDHELWAFHRMVIFFMVVLNCYGDKMSDFFYKRYQASLDESYTFKENSTKHFVEAIEAEKKHQWYAEGQSVLFDAKKENVGLQLEAVYRERQMSVYNEMKRRLDYQVDSQNMAKSFHQKNLVDWVLRHVHQSITPQQEQDALKQCMGELKLLSKAA